MRDKQIITAIVVLIAGIWLVLFSFLGKTSYEQNAIYRKQVFVSGAKMKDEIKTGEEFEKKEKTEYLIGGIILIIGSIIYLNLKKKGKI